MVDAVLSSIAESHRLSSLHQSIPTVFRNIVLYPRYIAIAISKEALNLSTVYQPSEDANQKLVGWLVLKNTENGCFAIWKPCDSHGCIFECLFPF